jgi:hypothetical protein
MPGIGRLHGDHVNPMLARKGINMKRMRSPDSVQLRRDLAQLLRSLRALRRERLADGELQWRITRAITQARSIQPFVTFGHTAGRPDANEAEGCQVSQAAARRTDAGPMHVEAVAADCA